MFDGSKGKVLLASQLFSKRDCPPIKKGEGKPSVQSANQRLSCKYGGDNLYVWACNSVVGRTCDSFRLCECTEEDTPGSVCN